MKINSLPTKSFSLALILALSAASSAKADVIAGWTFQTALSTNSIIGVGLTTGATQTGVLADIGIGTGSAAHASSSTQWSSPAGNGSTNSWSANNWAVGDYFQFQVSSLLYSGITVSFDQTGSGTGPRDFALQYSTDGSTFTAFGSAYTVLLNGGAPNVSWNGGAASPAYSYAFDLSAITALNNDSSIFFRIVDSTTTSINGGTVATGGTDRIDNFFVNGTVVPEPSTLALGGLGIFALSSLRRKK